MLKGETGQMIDTKLTMKDGKMDPKCKETVNRLSRDCVKVSSSLMCWLSIFILTGLLEILYLWPIDRVQSTTGGEPDRLPSQSLDFKFNDISPQSQKKMLNVTQDRIYASNKIDAGVPAIEHARIPINNNLSQPRVVDLRGQWYASTIPTDTKPADVQRIADEIEIEKSFFKLRPTKVNPYEHNFLVTPKKLCDVKTDALFLIHSFHSYLDRRQAIRDTWGSVAKGLADWPRKSVKDNLRMAFVLGRHKETRLDKLPKKENKLYNDMIQGTFYDSYNNMTLKSLLGLKFFKEYCKHAKVLIKSDDDMIVNIPYLMSVIHSVPMQHAIMGPLHLGSEVHRVGKWKMTKEQYPFEVYPPYEGGSTYVIEASLVTELYEAAEYVPHIFIDDVYITGILGKTLNVTHIVQPGFAYWMDRAPSSCDIIEDRKLAGTKMKPEFMRKIWKDIVNDVKNCPRFL